MQGAGFREVVREWGESLGVALILALILRHFVVEAFKIPTKSMEPTLVGDPASGDKILVNKFIYDLEKPQRGDVIVFKNPQNPEKNYIKRLIGLPGENILIRRGDIYVDGKIWRKCRSVQRALWMPVSTEDLLWDEVADRHTRRIFVQEGNHDVPGIKVFEKWQIANHSRRKELVKERRLKVWKANPEEAWTSDAQGLNVVPKGDEIASVRYHRLRIYDRVLTATGKLTPQIDEGFENRGYHSARRLNQVDDLRIRFHVRPEQEGEIQIVLVDSYFRFVAHLPVGTGNAQIEMGAKTGETKSEIKEVPRAVLKPGKTSRVSFSNVDDTLMLEVNDKRVFEQPYDPVGKKGRNYSRFDIEVSFSALKTPARFTEIRLERDIYYLAHFSGTTSRDDKWQLKVKEYFVLGDNSPNSRDSRLWENGHSVPEENLIGQAFMVFWPPKRLRIIR